MAELRVLLADRLAQVRQTKTQLAARSGLGRTTVHEAFARGRPAPSAATVAALARALSLDAAHLLELHRQAVG
ncbi:helix-turn-helix domain-containing protein [Kitasatospora sp. NPDC058063]|uniref:helix-turn-helix domain-containing protein n=1 Tax=unclassified Kitasatospora TaxID=2633591 RepID=UPI0036DD5C1A